MGDYNPNPLGIPLCQLDLAQLRIKQSNANSKRPDAKLRDFSKPPTNPTKENAG